MTPEQEHMQSRIIRAVKGSMEDGKASILLVDQDTEHFARGRLEEIGDREGDHYYGDMEAVLMDRSTIKRLWVVRLVLQKVST